MGVDHEPRLTRLGGFAVLVHDDRMLLALGDYGPKRWALPGGLVEVGESTRDAAIRETKEETGLDIDLGDLVAVVEAEHIVLFVYAASVTGGIERPEPGEIAELRWFALDELDEIADRSWALAAEIARRVLTDGLVPFEPTPLTGPGGGPDVWTVRDPGA